MSHLAALRESIRQERIRTLYRTLGVLEELQIRSERGEEMESINLRIQKVQYNLKQLLTDAPLVSRTPSGPPLAALRVPDTRVAL